MNSDRVEKAARVIYQCRHPAGDPVGGEFDGPSWAEIEMRDARATAEVLDRAGLIAPAPLHVVTATNQFGESHRRWATEWEPVDRAEGDGRADR